MSDSAKLLSETKKEILSLLVCLGATGRNQGVSVNQFFKDYREQIGIAIPYKHLGYATVEDFFHQIPDTVKLSFGRDGPVLNAVENDAISHIVALVDNQKTTVVGTRQKRLRKRGGYCGTGRVGRGGGRGGFNRDYQDGPRDGYGSGIRQYSQTFYSASQNHTNSYCAPVSKKPMFQQPRQLTTQAQQNRYEPQWARQTETTSPAPLKRYEPASSQNTTHEFEEVEQQKSEPVQDPPTVPILVRKMIRELLTAYPNGIYGENVSIAFSRRFGESINPVSLGFKNMYHLFSAMTDILELEELADDFRIKQLDLKPISARPKPDPVEPLHNECGDGSYLRQTSMKLRNPNDYCRDDNLLKLDVQQVLADYPKDGIWNKEFSNIFKNVIGIDLPWKQLGYPSVIDMMGEMSDVVVILRESTHGDWKLFDKRIKSTPTKDSLLDPPSRVRSAPLPQLSEPLKEAIRQVVCSHVEGLPLYELAEIFKEMTGKALALREIGFSSLDALVQRLNADNVVNLDYRGEGLVLLTAVNTDPANGYLLKKPGLGQKRYCVPSDAVGQGVRFKHQVPPEPSLESYVEMYLLTVDDLDTFWLQIKGKETSEALEDLLDQLENVYKGDSSERYCIPDSMLVADQIAAARFQDDNWYRVTIMERTDDHFVKVYFTDWGGTCNVHKENLRFLKNVFLQQLPAQSLRAKFYGIAAPPGGYTASSTNRLLELSSGEALTGANRTLHALIVEVDKVNDVMSVCLVDMQDDKEVHIQDVLVEEGYAVFNGDKSEVDAEPANEPTDMGPVEAGSVEPSTSINIAYVSPMKMNLNTEERMEEQQYDSEQGSPTCVKLVQLTDEHAVHIINFENQPYVISSEISTFFWDKDLLRSMLRHKRMDIPRKVLTHEDYMDVFDEFMFYEIPGVVSRDGEPKTHLTIYSLGGIPTILDTFANPSKDLQPIREAVLRELHNFNPDEPYWRGEYADDLSSNGAVSETGSYTMDQLEVAEKSLQHRRSQMVAHMLRVMNETETAILTEDLQNIEQTIVDVRKRIKKEKKRENRTDEEFIGHCISQQYQELTPLAATAAQGESSGNPATSDEPSCFEAGSGTGGVATPATSSAPNAMDMSALLLGMNMMTLSAGMGMGVGAMPGMGSAGPGLGGAMPGLGGAAPGLCGAAPGLCGAAPGLGGAMPGLGGAAPGLGMGMPGLGGAIPGLGGAIPGMGGAGGFMLGAAGLLNPATMPVQPLQLNPDQQQFMNNYNQILQRQQQQQVFSQNPVLSMANMNMMGISRFGAAPAAQMMNNLGMSVTAPRQMGAMPQLSMAEMSLLLLSGQGRGAPRNTQPAGVWPTGLQNQKL